MWKKDKGFRKFSRKKTLQVSISKQLTNKSSQSNIQTYIYKMKLIVVVPSLGWGNVKHLISNFIVPSAGHPLQFGGT